MRKGREGGGGGDKRRPLIKHVSRNERDIWRQSELTWGGEWQTKHKLELGGQSDKDRG